LEGSKTLGGGHPRGEGPIKKKRGGESIGRNLFKEKISEGDWKDVIKQRGNSSAKTNKENGREKKKKKI